MASVVVALCMATVMFDGYDLQMFGVIGPSLLAYQPWALSPAEVGAIGSYALVGMLIGALVVGVLTDIVGWRRVMLGCIAFFSVFMGACALAPTPGLLGLFRFLAGLGLGGVAPTAIALTVEFAPVARRQTYNAVMFCGIAAGGVLAALLGLVVIPSLGFRAMFWIGTAPLVLVLPLVALLLPESPRYLMSVGKAEQARSFARRHGLQLPDQTSSAGRRSAGRAVGELFGRGFLASTLLFAVASFSGLLLAYGLSTWLPTIMQRSGYGLGPSISFLLVLNLGAIIGSISAATLADRFGSKPVVAAAFGASAIAILVLSIKPPVALSFVLVAVAGLGSIGGQILVNGFVASRYPDRIRATALGWSLGVGRLGAIAGPAVGGLLLGSALGLNANFYAYVAVAVLGCLAILAIPARRPTPVESQPAHDPLTTAT
ncbi:MFS transporter [Streptomyces sp. NBC_01361]|uniref:MFS transporter n=1 Tax=Streptomyces sp. NBC_01361 TaxID=2903838 RepID=UPI002E2F8DBC|nr:aromatic acid/H+ symport family MFS transporter [Streptomyces sp. NBC_01361]